MKAILVKLAQTVIIAGMVIVVLGCALNFEKTPASDQPSFSSIATVTDSPGPTLTPTFIVIPTLTPIPQTPTVTPVPVVLDPKKWKHITLPAEDIPTGKYEFAQAGDGAIWLVGIKIYRYDFKNWRVYDPQNIPVLKDKGIEAITVAPNGTVWFGTDMNEIVSFDGKTWASQTVEEGGYRKNEIVSIVARKNGELCAVSIEGMSCRKDTGGWIRHPIVLQNEVNHVYVCNVILSPSDEIWVPLTNGLLYHYDGENWEGWRINQGMGPVALSSDGSLWIVDGEGLQKRTISGNTTNIIHHELLDNLWEYPPNFMYEAKDGTLWIGCMGGNIGYQLIRYNRKGTFETADDKVIPMQYDPSDYLGIKYPFGHVYRIFQSRDGAIWFGTDNGIFRYHSN
jgi:ligand-binding sensor domain-containing protein